MSKPPCNAVTLGLTAWDKTGTVCAGGTQLNWRVVLRDSTAMTTLSRPVKSRHLSCVQRDCRHTGHSDKHSLQILPGKTFKHLVPRHGRKTRQLLAAEQLTKPRGPAVDAAEEPSQVTNCLAGFLQPMTVDTHAVTKTVAFGIIRFIKAFIDKDEPRSDHCQHRKDTK